MSTIPRKIPEESPWTTLLVSLAMVSMLALFYTVVSGAVKAGELRRQTMAAQSAAVLHCNALPGGGRTRACLKELGAKVSTEEPMTFAAK